MTLGESCQVGRRILILRRNASIPLQIVSVTIGAVAFVELLTGIGVGRPFPGATEMKAMKDSISSRTTIPLSALLPIENLNWVS